VRDNGVHEAIYKLSVVSNHAQVSLEPFFAVFETPDDVRSFSMHYSIRSHSMPNLIERELHIRVEEES
jgi:hypothetical protein